MDNSKYIGEKMKLSKEYIKEALELYNISDKRYKDKVYKCLEDINKNASLKEKVEYVLHTIYVKVSEDLRRKWKVSSIEEIFTLDAPEYITNIVLLLGYKIHIKNMNKFNFSEDEKIKSIIRVREALLSNIDNINKGIRISQMLWGAYIIDVRIIEVGRLQFEREFVNPLTNAKEDIVKIHIPKGERLEYNLVLKSLKDAKEYVKKYFGLVDVDYYCESWLLSLDILKIVDVNSNIYKFNKLFEILDIKDGLKDVLNFVFNEGDITDYTKLKENTSLQRKLKKEILAGNKIYKGVAKLKFT